MMIHIFWLVPAALAGAIVNCIIIFLLARLHTRDRRSDTYVYNIQSQQWEEAS